MPLDYLASVSHDLKSPLTAILGFVAMIKLDLSDHAVPERIIEDLNMVESLGEEMLVLIGNMLTAARLQAGKEPMTPARVNRDDLLAIIRALEKTFQAEAKSRKVDFSVSVAKLPPSVSWDLLRIRYFAINNLVSNALKFVGEGGKVEVGIDTDDADHVIIVVADNGPGVPLAEWNAIFEKLNQSSSNIRVHGGGGFGLFNAAQILRAHQGTIEVRDGIDGKGVAFEIRIPAHPFPAGNHGNPVQAH